MLKFHFGYTPCTTGSELSLAAMPVWRMSLARNAERRLGSRGDSRASSCSSSFIAADVVARRRASSQLRGSGSGAVLLATDAASMSVEFCIGRHRAASQPFG
jgi:hypothetical protein